MKLNLQYAVPNPGYTIYSAYNNNTNNTTGHQRKGSISSIQSMPVDQTTQNVTLSAPRSHSMTPIQPQGLPRKGSTGTKIFCCRRKSYEEKKPGKMPWLGISRKDHYGIPTNKYQLGFTGGF